MNEEQHEKREQILAILQDIGTEVENFQFRNAINLTVDSLLHIKEFESLMFKGITKK